MLKYKFMISEHGETDLDFDGTTFESPMIIHNEKDEFFEIDLRGLANDAADYAFSNCDGWEWDWPVTFEIYTEDSRYLGSCCVAVEYEPMFYASVLEKGKPCY